MDSIDNGSLACLGTKIAYRRRGGPGPSLLLIHGIADDGRCWEPFLPSIDPDWDVVMVDLRGHGLSEDPEEGWTFDRMADEVDGLRRALALERPFAAGVSLGGAVALIMAARHPGSASALFLEDPVPFWAAAPEGAREAAGRGLADWLLSVKRKTEADLRADFASFAQPWDYSERRAWVESKLRMSPRAIRIALAMDAAPASDIAALSRLDVPAFLICAEVGHGALNRDGDLAELKALLPRLETLRLSGAGHNVRRESPDAYREAFLSFFEGVRRA